MASGNLHYCLIVFKANLSASVEHAANVLLTPWSVKVLITAQLSDGTNVCINLWKFLTGPCKPVAVQKTVLVRRCAEDTLVCIIDAVEHCWCAMQSASAFADESTLLVCFLYIFKLLIFSKALPLTLRLLFFCFFEKILIHSVDF